MRALIFSAINEVEMQDRLCPEPGSGEVLIKVALTGVCGSDLHGFLGHSPRRQPGLVLGHETVGTITKVGEGVDVGFEGTRVAVNPLISCDLCTACRQGRHNCCLTWRLLGMDQTAGAMAEYVVIPARNAHRIPDSVSDASAVMVEPLANAARLMRHAQVASGVRPTCAVLGYGTLGACIAAAAKVSGIQVLAITERNTARANVARDAGFGNVIDPTTTDAYALVQDLTAGEGMDIVFDAVGSTESRNLAAKCVRRGGAALLLGMLDPSSSFDFSDLIRREVRLQCSFAYAEEDFRVALGWVERGEVNFEPWTSEYALSDGQIAFDRLVKDPGDRLKIALRP